MRPFVLVKHFICSIVTTAAFSLYLSVVTSGNPSVQTAIQRDCSWLWCSVMLGVGGIKLVAVGNDGTRANLDGVECTGHGNMLYVVVDSSNFVSPMKVDGCRLKWRQGSYPYTAFMRNCNLTDTPRSCRGLLCIFRKQGEEVYRLGVVGNLSPLWCKKLTIHEWTGSSIMDSGVYTSEFLYFATAFPLDFQTVKSPFTPVK